MKTRVLVFSSFVSLALLQGATPHPHHSSMPHASPHAHHATSKGGCDFEAIKSQSNTPSQEVNALMHAPMMCTPYIESGNIETDFLGNMIPHHEGAILSSKALLKYTKNTQLAQIAQQIILTQEKEIADFQELIKELDKSDSKDYDAFAKKAREDMDKMMEEMSKVASSGDVDQDYMQAMIAHHQGAIDAAKEVLEFTKHPQVIKIAQDIISTQEDEIQKFKKLLGEK